MDIINTGRKDVLWSYIATFLKIGVGVILLPFILRVFSQETVAIWNIFLTIIVLTTLFDFGFNQSFARNVSYVISGVKELKTTGYQPVESNVEIDYSLFKGLINAMKWFYSRMSIVFFAVLTTAGTYYMHTVLQSYTGNHNEVYIAWIILILINSYSLYTYYYDSLMQGKGLIKRAKQIEVIGQIIYLSVAVVLILLEFNLIAIISAQSLSIIIRRILSHHTIYTYKFKHILKNTTAVPKREYIKPILPNAIKLGLTSLGGFFVTRSALIIGPICLPLTDIASYGITIQIINVIAGIAGVYFIAYQPKIAQCRIYNNNNAIKQIYTKGCILMLAIFIIGCATLLIFGNWALTFIDSKTPLLPSMYIAVTLLVSFLETNHGHAAWILLTKNEVPFFKPSIISGIFTVIGLLVMLHAGVGIASLVIIPLIVDVSYQSWKWPLEVMKDLNIIGCPKQLKIKKF